ncbi:hypothetical protein ABID59_001969 [Bradyrhizobium sp. S3.3.6]|uniref:SAM domain-containing protein n=1 Tax=Bradyrhizobium cytisi TaxID=515489 RepID=A0A5S4WKG5_9BRAD|nr:SAM domain-containing protein [Bradyrhizobium cytisi]TYL80764.1 hypothetical protein FXB38_23945 [Bradyrhizobium cytisi]
MKDLGVGIVGHRRKLLDGIACLSAQFGTPEPPGSSVCHEAEKGTAEPQVTVMFSDPDAF